MLILYHANNTRSFRVLWTLEEMGIPYQLHRVPMAARAQPDYLALNPLGTVPTLFDDGVRMTESTAIAHYLVSRYGPTPLTVEPSEPEYASYLNFLVHGEATLTFPQSVYVRYKLLEPQKGLGGAGDDYMKWFLARLRLVEQTLLEREFLCAQRFTVADISVSYAIMLAEYLGYADELPSVVREYWSRLQKRPAYGSAVAIQSNEMA